MDKIYGDGKVKIGPNERFVVEIKPSVGAILTVDRRLPPSLDPIMELG